MEGLIGVRSTASTNSAIEWEFEFLDPPADVINVLEYAMVNALRLDLPVSGMSVAVSVRIVGMNIENEVLTNTVGVPPTSISTTLHRRVTVRGRQ